MRSRTETANTLGAALLLIIILTGSPLATFGCHTIVPEQFQVPCETAWGNTAVQHNFIQPLTATLAILIPLTIAYWLIPACKSPQPLFLLPPLPPPRQNA